MKNPLRVLMVVSAQDYGARKHTLDLACELSKIGVCTTLACASLNDNETEILLENNIAVELMPLRREVSFYNDFRVASILIKLLLSGEFDLIHGHCAKAGFLARYVASKTGVPCVYTPHSVGHLRNFGVQSFFYRIAERWAGRHTDAIIAVSKSEKVNIISEGIARKERLYVIENAIDAHGIFCNLTSSEAKAKLGLDSEKSVVGFIGRLCAQKMPMDFLSIVEGIDASVVICGDGPLRKECEKLNTDAVFLGQRFDMPIVYKAIDVLVICSKYEGLPYVLLESMALGVPVVSYNTGGVAEYVKEAECGIVVSLGDVTSAKNAVVEILNDTKKSNAFSTSGVSAYAKKESLEMMAEATMGVYKSVVSL